MLIFEDNNIEVFFDKRGDDKKIIITFGDMLSVANGKSYYAQAPLQKIGYSSIGIMPKSTNWYPLSSMEKCNVLIKNITKNYNYIICIGGSMGGYGALKYSRKLNATHVIAYVPQFSINPKDIRDNRYNMYYNEHLNKDMKISSNDLSGDVILIYDYAFLPDALHAYKIISLDYDIRNIPVRFTNHHATAVLAGTDFLYSIISHHLNNAYDKISLEIKNKKKNSIYYHKIFFSSLILRHKKILKKILLIAGEKHLFMKLNLPPDVEQDLLIFSHNYEVNNLEEKLKSKIKISGLNIKGFNYGKYCMIDAHGRYLHYSFITQTFIAIEKITLINCYIVPVMTDQIHGLILINNTPCKTSKNNVLQVDLNEYNDKSLVTYFTNTKFETIIYCGTKNLTTDKVGQSYFHAAHILAWEKYKLKEASLFDHWLPGVT